MSINEPEEITTSFSYSNIIDKVNSFAINLFINISDIKENNIIVSPVCIQKVLALMLNGSIDKTAQEIAQLLNVGNDLPKVNELCHSLESALLVDPNVHVVTALFIHDSYKVTESFMLSSGETFNTNIVKIDGSNTQRTAEVINSWMADKTNNEITDVIKENELSQYFSVIAFSGLSFNGIWDIPFDPEATQNQKFFLHKKYITVDMMHTTGEFRYNYSFPLRAKILELPYYGNHFSMYLMLPDDINGINALESNLINVNITDEFLKLRKRLIKVSLPKFKISNKINFKNILKSNGVKSIFDRNDAKCTFVSNSNANLDDIVQKMIIEVNEKGSEDHPRPVYNLSNESSVSVQVIKNFEVNRPFLFMITRNNFEESCCPMLLCIGKFVDDTEQTGNNYEGLVELDAHLDYDEASVYRLSV